MTRTKSKTAEEEFAELREERERARREAIDEVDERFVAGFRRLMQKHGTNKKTAAQMTSFSRWRVDMLMKVADNRAKEREET